MPTDTWQIKHYELVTPDGVPLRLTRHIGGSKGPVLLVHGAGMSGALFSARTQRENFVQYLATRGYDTWVLDWRASIALPLRQFTLDEAAEHDYPAAVALVLRETGAQSIQAVVHGEGSVSFFMSLASGKLPAVRGVACSQAALHFDVPPVGDAKALMRLPDLLAASGREYMTPTVDPESPLFQAVFGQVVDLVRHECRSTTCHRLTFLYGRLYNHENLDGETHEQLHEQFGKFNMLAFRHMAQLTRSGVARKFDYGASDNRRRYAQDEPPNYLDPQHLRIPISFIASTDNRAFLPRSTALTHDWLTACNGPELYTRHLLPDYGHVDPFLGSFAARDAYPLFLELLERSAT